MHLLPCLLPTPSLPPKVVQSNGIAHESYQQSGYNNTAADDYGNDSTMSPTSQADEMPTWDDWDDDDPAPDYDRPTGAGPRFGPGSGATGNFTRGDDTCKWTARRWSAVGVGRGGVGWGA